MVKTLNVGIQMKACKNAIYFIFFCKRRQIDYKSTKLYLFIYFCLVYKDAVKLKNLCLAYKDADKLKKLLGVNEIQSKKNNNLVTKSTYRGCKDAPYISTFPIGR